MRLFAVLALTFVSAYCSAQYSRAYVGVISGANFSGQSCGTPIPGYSGGLLTGITVGKRWEFQAEVQFAQRGFGSKKSTYSQDVIPGGTNPEWGLPRNYKFHIQHFYIDIPTTFKCFVGNKPSPFYFTAGLSTQIHLGSRNLHRYFYGGFQTERVVEANDEEVRKVNIAAIAGFGVDFRLLPSARGFVQPTLMTQLLTNDPSGHHFTDVGFMIGLIYHPSLKATSIPSRKKKIDKVFPCPRTL